MIIIIIVIIIIMLNGAFRNRGVQDYMSWSSASLLQQIVHKLFISWHHDFSLISAMETYIDHYNDGCTCPT